MPMEVGMTKVTWGEENARGRRLAVEAVKRARTTRDPDDAIPTFVTAARHALAQGPGVEAGFLFAMARAIR
jgi:hypothetical protein